MAELLAEFAAPDDLVAAIEALRRAGYRELEAFTPYEVREAKEALDAPRPPLAAHCLLGAVGGAILGFWIQWWANAVDYPLNVGGRPLASFPAFIPATFEGAILGGALFTFFAFLWRCRLPRLSHPLFSVEGFERASDDRFFLRVGGTGAGPDPVPLLDAHGALRVVGIPE